MTHPEVGEQVTIQLSFPTRLVRATVSFVSAAAGKISGAWSAEPEEPTFSGIVRFDLEGDGRGPIHMWDIDPNAIEGVGWCRGWDGPAVDALRVAAALS